MPRFFCRAPNIPCGEHLEEIVSGWGGTGVMFFTFPQDARWNAVWQAAEFGGRNRERRGVVGVARRVFQRPLPEEPTPERCTRSLH
jgi:hypothetical protein